MKGGLNRYAYGSNNPLRWIDLLGLFCTSDFVKHYYTGGGSTIDLAAVGLLGGFQKSASVQGSVNAFKNKARAAAAVTAASLCKGCEKGPRTGSFRLNDRDVTDVRGDPCLYSVGHSTFFRKAGCGVTADCDKRTFSFSCSLAFSIRDWFEDPIGVGIEPGGTPYRINGDWADSLSGGGSF